MNMRRLNLAIYNKCTQGLAEFIELISTTLALLTKVRWLVSSRPYIKLKNAGTARCLVQLDPSVLKDPVTNYIEAVRLI
jgi:hypothetical protein